MLPHVSYKEEAEADTIGRRRESNVFVEAEGEVIYP